MNISIEIHYKADSKISRSASFQLKGRKPELIALNWWKQIKKEMSYHAELEKVIINRDQDITQQIKDLEIQEWRNIEDKWNLPF